MKNLAMILVVLVGCSRTDKSKADAAAKEYITHIKGAESVECADVDSDGDGYVSCTVFRGALEPMPIQCGAEKWCVWNCASGCKYVPFAAGGRLVH